MRPKSTPLSLGTYFPSTKLQPSLYLCSRNKLPQGQALLSKQVDFIREIGKDDWNGIKMPCWKATASWADRVCVVLSTGPAAQPRAVPRAKSDGPGVCGMSESFCREQSSHFWESVLRK